MPPCGRTSAVFLNHIWGSSCNWSCHQIKFMTISCHFPRFKRHLHRPKRQVKRSWHSCAPHLPPGCDGGHGLRSSPWMEHPFLITILGERVSSLSFSSDDSSRPSCQGSPSGDYARGPASPCHWEKPQGGSAGLLDPPRSDSGPDFPLLMTTSPHFDSRAQGYFAS